MSKAAHATGHVINSTIFFRIRRYGLGIYVTVLSVTLLVGVAADRYLSVVHSLKYHSFMRFKLAK